MSDIFAGDRDGDNARTEHFTKVNVIASTGIHQLLLAVEDWMDQASGRECCVETLRRIEVAAQRLKEKVKSQRGSA